MDVQEQIPITKGEDAVFRLKFRKKNGDPFSLTAYDMFKICIKGAASNVTVTETADASSLATFATPKELGFVDVVIKADKTELLREDENADATVTLDNSSASAPKIKNLKDLFIIESPTCS